MLGLLACYPPVHVCAAIHCWSYSSCYLSSSTLSSSGDPRRNYFASRCARREDFRRGRSLRARGWARVLFHSGSESAQSAHCGSRECSEPEERRGRILRRLHGRASQRCSARGTAPCCWKFPTAGTRAFFRLVDGGDEDLRRMPEMHGCCATASPSSAWDGSGMRPAPTHSSYTRRSRKKTGRPSPGCCAAISCFRRVMDEIPLGHLIRRRHWRTRISGSAPHDPRNTLTVAIPAMRSAPLIPRTEWRLRADG